MDAKLLIAEVAKRHGILLDANDPVLVTVTLNELVLEEYVRRVSAAVEQGERRAIAASERQLAIAKQAGGEIVTRAAAYVADQVRAVAAEACSEIEQRVASAATSVHADACAAARHRNRAFAFMMASALATALALSGIAITCCGTGRRDANAASVSNAARASVGSPVGPDSD